MTQDYLEGNVSPLYNHHTVSSPLAAPGSPSTRFPDLNQYKKNEPNASVSLKSNEYCVSRTIYKTNYFKQCHTNSMAVFSYLTYLFGYSVIPTSNTCSAHFSNSPDTIQTKGVKNSNIHFIRNIFYPFPTKSSRYSVCYYSHEQIEIECETRYIGSLVLQPKN